ncbi:hypothetical protein AAC387_Pa02g2737 [Persea americana]
MIHASATRSDLDRFGVIYRPSPPPARRRDRRGFILHMPKSIPYSLLFPLLTRVYDQMPEPWGSSPWEAAQMAVASITTHTLFFLVNYSYFVVQCCDMIIPVDIYVPGCPPIVEALIFGILRKKINQRRDFFHWWTK